MIGEQLHPVRKEITLVDPPVTSCTPLEYRSSRQKTYPFWAVSLLLGLLHFGASNLVGMVSREAMKRLFASNGPIPGGLSNLPCLLGCYLLDWITPPLNYTRWFAGLFVMMLGSLLMGILTASYTRNDLRRFTTAGQGWRFGWRHYLTAFLWLFYFPMDYTASLDFWLNYGGIVRLIQY